MIHFRLSSALALALIASLHLAAQTGPGGVESTNGASNLILWLDANQGTFSDAGVTATTNGSSLQQWNDLSGYNNHTTQVTAGRRPTWNTNVVNGMPSVNFNSGGPNYLEHSFPLNPSTSDYSFFIVFNCASGDNALLQQTDGTGVGRTNLYTNTGSNPLSSYIGGGTRSSSITYVPNNWAISGTKFNSNGASSAISFNQNGASGGTVSGFTPESATGNWLTGINRNLSSQAVDGNVSEIIMFNQQLNDAQFIIIQNYLSAKYNISLTANDLYSYKTTYQGNVIGIGQASNGTNHTTSTGDGILTISNPSGLANNEFLFTGHDQENISYSDTCDLPGIYGKKLDRTWRVTETGEVGTISVEFDLSTLSGLGAESDLTLLISSSPSFANATAHTTGRSLTGSTLSFTGVNFSDGDYFTIAQAGIYYNAGSWFNGSGPSNAPSTADGTNKVSIADDVTLTASANCKCVQVETGNVLSVGAGVTLTVNDGVANNGTITLANSASLLQTAATNNNSGSGTYNITRNTGTLPDDTRYQYWSSPVSNTTMGGVFIGSNTTDFYYFNASTQNWSSQGSGAAMLPGVGYITTGTIGIVSASEERTFSGTVNNGPVSINSGISSGQNLLLGNPYPSAISSNTFIADNSGINGTIWFWNHTTEEVGGVNSVADYATWNGLGATGGNSTKAPDDYIQTCQGFFVEASSANPMISFNNAQRASGNNTQFFKQGQDQRKRLWLSARNDSNDVNQLLVGYLPQATEGVDRLYDGAKYKGHPRISFYSMLEEKPYSIQGLPDVGIEATSVVPLGLDAWIAGTYTIHLDSIDNWPAAYSVYLEDKLLDTIINLQKVDTYSFTLDSIGEVTNRFYLNVKHRLLAADEQPVDIGDNEGPGSEEGDVTGIADADIAKANIYRSGEALIIEAGDEGVKQVSIYDLSGRLCYEQAISGHITNIPWNKTGVFVVSIKTTTNNTRRTKVSF